MKHTQKPRTLDERRRALFRRAQTSSALKRTMRGTERKNQPKAVTLPKVKFLEGEA